MQLHFGMVPRVLLLRRLRPEFCFKHQGLIVEADWRAAAEPGR